MKYEKFKKTKRYFRCSSGQYISQSRICDEEKNCNDGSDESDSICEDNCSLENCNEKCLRGGVECQSEYYCNTYETFKDSCFTDDLR